MASLKMVAFGTIYSSTETAGFGVEATVKIRTKRKITFRSQLGNRINSGSVRFHTVSNPPGTQQPNMKH